MRLASVPAAAARARIPARTGWPPRRSSGVILHPAALPEGTLGPGARAFVDWLVAAGQSFWQVLPLGPPDDFGSPYASASAFAGWPGLLERPSARVTGSEIEDFRRRHAYWIDDWVAYEGGDDEVVADQVRFEREWLALRRYANARGVRIVGDLPIYVARDSADVASHPEYFDPAFAAGVPPDLFTRNGQLWGNPTYRWPALRRDGYVWWIERFRRTLELVDATRLDHFRGFVAYYAVPWGARTARRGRWRRSSGLPLFAAVEAALGTVPLIAEDLGVITPPVHRLREAIGALGMHVLQFGFGPDAEEAHAPQHHRELSVVYTGTHDHPPVAAWWDAAPAGTRSRVAESLAAFSIDEDDPVWALIELAQASPARLAIVQAQDVLGLGEAARTNTPGTTSGNWRWRLAHGQLTRGHARRLRAACARRGRLPAERP